MHFLAGVPRLDAQLNTLARASKQLAPLMLCFALLLVGFSTAFTLAFGTQACAPLSMLRPLIALGTQLDSGRY